MVVSHHILCGYSISAIYKYDDIKNKQDVHTEIKIVWENLFESLKKHAMG